ncbi:MAG: CPBP family intramembrane metalloprotease [Flavobacteriaceae bacterium]|nr:CPBP family intramembrane metalloprotease [Flavobacteriaceae bacterium]
MKNNINLEAEILKPINYKGFFLDLIIYISVMFLVREIYIPKVGFIANGLFWSFTTLVVAMWRMRVRGVSWKDLGLKKPDNLWKTLGVSVIIFASVMISIIIFELIKDNFPFSISPDNSSESAVSKFGDLKGNWLLFFTIIPMVLLESFLEELLDRGFLMNWLEKLFSKTSFATILAVLLQAFIFGFRHSNDLSERSITVGIIGLVMGIAYIKFGRNLWPLIIAHCILNSMSMIDRVL